MRGGGGGGWKFLVTEIFVSPKMFLGSEAHTHIFFGGGVDFGVFGAPHAPTRGSRGVGKRYTSSYDHDTISAREINPFLP